MNLKKYIIFLSIAALFIKAPAIASKIDINQYGDFSSRSLLMRDINGNDKMSQEIKDLLKEKRLSPNIASMISQIK